MKLSSTIALMAIAMAGIASAANFHTIAGISSSTANFYPVGNLIQGPGVGFSATEPHAKILGGAGGNWVTDAPGGFPSDYIAVAGAPVLTIDLGSDKLLQEISLWGYDASNANGASEVEILFATEADGPGGFGTSITYNPTFDLVIDTNLRQSFLFSEQFDARYVQLTLTDNFFSGGGSGPPPGGDRVGLGEVAFYVPEPSRAMFLAFGFGAMIIRRRR